MAAIGSIFWVLCLGLEYVVYRLSRLAGGRVSVTQWQQRWLGQPVGKWRWGAGVGGAQSGADRKTRSSNAPPPAPRRRAHPACLLRGGDGGHGCLSAWGEGSTWRQSKRRARFFPCLCPCSPRCCKFSSNSIWLMDWKWLNQKSKHTKLTPKIAITQFLVRLGCIQLIAEK